MKVLFAAGGSAGHVDPALATAEALKDLSPTASITFMGTNAGIESKLVPSAGFPLLTIEKLPFPRRLSISSLVWPMRAFSNLQRARRIVRDFDVVVGFGGYVSAFGILAAYLQRVPRIVHEANALPGMANRLAARLGAVAFVSYPRAEKQMKDARLMALPLRKSMQAAPMDQSEAKQFFDVPVDLPTVLIVGGSLGARRLNAMVSKMVTDGGSLPYSIIHSLGHDADLPEASSRYRPLPYIERMDVALSAADLVISRAGAGAVAQISRFEVPAIFIPLWHGNGEQGANAAPAAGLGAALVLNEDDALESRLLIEVNRLIGNSTELSQMKSAYAKLPASLHSCTGAHEMTAEIIAQVRAQVR